MLQKSADFLSVNNSLSVSLPQTIYVRHMLEMYHNSGFIHVNIVPFRLPRLSSQRNKNPSIVHCLKKKKKRRMSFVDCIGLLQ